MSYGNDSIDSELREFRADLFISGPQNKGPNETEYLIKDSIFCELTIIQGILLNGVTYIKGYFYLGSAYLSLAFWVRQFKSYCKANPDEKVRLNDELRKLTGTEEMHHIHNEEYAYQKALDSFYRCINMHNEGEVYHDTLSNMYFTEGDFNDDNQHFSAAIDRWLINTKIVRNRIEYIQRELKRESIFSNKLLYYPSLITLEQRRRLDYEILVLSNKIPFPEE